MIVSVRVKNKSYFNHKTRGDYPMGVAAPFFITNFLFIVVAVTFNTSRNLLLSNHMQELMD